MSGNGKKRVRFRRALALNPNNSAAHYFMRSAVWLRKTAWMRRWSSIELPYRSTRSRRSSAANYALLLMEARRYPESLAQFQKVLARDPNFPPAHYSYRSSTPHRPLS